MLWHLANYLLNQPRIGRNHTTLNIKQSNEEVTEIGSNDTMKNKDNPELRKDMDASLAITLLNTLYIHVGRCKI